MTERSPAYLAETNPDPRTHLLSEAQLRLIQGAMERAVSGYRLGCAGLHSRDNVLVARGLARINEALADVAEQLRRIGGAA